MFFFPSWAKIKGSLFLLRSFLQGASIHKKLVIFGPAHFRQNIVQALNLLKEHAPDTLALLQRYISSVSLAKNSGVLLARRPAVVLWGYRSADKPLIELASDLAHEAFHCKLYWEYRDSHDGQQPPDEIFSGQLGEEKSVRYQCDVLKRLGASPEVIAEYEKALETKYWKIPLEHRTW